MPLPLLLQSFAAYFLCLRLYSNFRYTKRIKAGLLIALYTIATDVLLGQPAEVTVGTPTLSFDQRYILETDSEHDALYFNIEVNLTRSQVGGSPRDIPLRVTVELYAEGSGNYSKAIGSVSNTQTVEVPALIPVLPVSIDLSMVPSRVLMDNINYEFRIIVEHNDNPPKAEFQTDATATSNPFRIPHFTGDLIIPGVDTATMLRINGLPQFLGDPGRWRLRLISGHLSTGVEIASAGAGSSTFEVERDIDGNCTLIDGVFEAQPESNEFEVNGWSGNYGDITVSTEGIQASRFFLNLPEGVGWRVDDALETTTATLNPVFDSDAQSLALNLNLQPLSGVSGSMNPGYEFIDERYALGFVSNNWTWDTNHLILDSPERRFLRARDYDLWIQQRTELPDSNDGYLHQLQPGNDGQLLISPGPKGGISVTIDLAPGEFSSHFPLAVISHEGGTFELVDSVVNAGSSLLEQAQPAVASGLGCRSPLDPNGLPEVTEFYLFAAGDMSFTAQGGLSGENTLLPDPSAGTDPEIVRRAAAGLTNEGEDPTHETSLYTTETVHLYMPGPNVPSSDGLDSNEDSNTIVDETGEHPQEFNPARWLYTGIDQNNDGLLVHPGTKSYLSGIGEYAGVNFRQFEGQTGSSRIGGSVYGPYVMDACTKLYTRLSGLSGIWVADNTSLPPSLQAGGFDLQLDDWAFSVLSNQALDKVVSGNLDLPYPADISLEFDELGFNCCGNLGELVLSDGESIKSLRYWHSSQIEIGSARFVAESNCSMDNARLEIGANGLVNGLSGQHPGFLYFFPSGRLTTGEDLVFGPSYLEAGLSREFAGAYNADSVRHLYFNDPGNTPPDPGDDIPGEGIINFAGHLDVPFFEPPGIHAHMHGQAGLPEPIIPQVARAQGGWTEEGHTFFDNANHDLSHQGHPGSGLNSYIQNANYYPEFFRDWFGFIPFGFQLRYDAITQHFYSENPEGQDVVILKAEANVPRLNAEKAEVRFGLGFGLSLNNLFADALSYGTEGFAHMIAEEVLDQIETGLDEISEVLDSQIRTAISAAILPPIESTIVQPIQAEIKSGNLVADTLDNLLVFDSTALGLANQVSTNITDRLNSIGQGLETLDTILATPETLGSLIQESIGFSGFENQVNLSVEEIIGLAGIDAGVFAERMFAIRERIMETRAALNELQNAVAFTQEISGIFNDVSAGFDTLGPAIRPNLETYLETVAIDPSSYSSAEIESRILAEIESKLWAIPAFANLQTTIRQRLYFIDDTIRELIASSLQQLNNATAEFISEVVDFDQQLANFTGFGSYLQGSGVNGQAIIVGKHDLKQLRIDAHTVINVPPVPIELEPFFEYKHLNSDGSRSCRDADGLNPPAKGITTNEITFGATAAPAIMPGGENSATITAKFSFLESGVPIGFMGSMEITQSGSSMQPLRFDRLTGMLNIGGTAFENFEFYFAAFGQATIGASPSPIQLPFTNYKLDGGIFFGRTCSLEPLAWAPPELNLDPPFFGAVAAVDGKFPFYDLSCLLRVKAEAAIGTAATVKLVDASNADYPGGNLVPQFTSFLEGGVSGDFLCLASASGSVSLVGSAGPEGASMAGAVEAQLKLGPCPLCVKKNVDMGAQLDTDSGISVDF